MSEPFSPRVVDVLKCPYCGMNLRLSSPAVSLEVFTCDHGHTFDRARQGYLTLLGKHSQQKTADTLDMVMRRARFHEADYYAPFAAEIAGQLKAEMGENPTPLLGDFGAGTGYYAQALIAAMPEAQCIALDLSKRALQRAKALGVFCIVADTWAGFPLRDHVLDGAINVFAPRNGQEFARVLKSGAPLIVSTPTQKHMHEVRSAAELIKIGRQDHEKREDVRSKLDGYFDFEKTTLTEFELVLSGQDVEDLVMMGPNAYHTNLDDLCSTITALPQPFHVTFSVESHLYHAR